MVQLKYLVFVLCLVVCTHQLDYCSRSLCGSRHHIGCHHSGKFANRCQQPELVPMTHVLNNMILTKHNYFRNLIASGSERRFQSAAKMPLLKWNNELAYLAKLNVLQCRMNHDDCHNTARFKFAGQNLAVLYSTGRINTMDAVNRLITSWYNEHIKTSINDIHNFQSKNLHAIGHFTAMIQDKANDVGCAIAKYKSRGYNYLLLACDYSYTNVLGHRVYTIGRSCSQCRTGCDQHFKSLCSSKELVNPNP